MDKFLEKLNKAKSKINLSSERKEDLYLKIISAAAEREQRVKFEPVGFWKLSLRVPATIFASILGLMVITASTSFASEGSLPGDVLYAVKRNVNENVLRLLANTTQKRAALAADLVERRLSEATQLASLGRLTQDVSDSLVVEIEKTSAEARSQISLLQEQKVSNVAIAEASRLETALRANGAVLKGVISKKKKTEPLVLADLDSKIDNLAFEAEGVRASIEDSVLSTRSMLFMAAKMAPVIESATTTANEKPADEVFTKEFTEDSLEKVKKSIDEFKEKVKEREKDRNYNSDAVNSVIESAEKDIEEAKNNLDNNDVKNSLRFINQSDRKVREAEIINEAEQKLDVEVFEVRAAAGREVDFGGELRN